MLTTDKAHKASQSKCGNTAVNHISLYRKRGGDFAKIQYKFWWYNFNSNHELTAHHLCWALCKREVSDLKKCRLIIRQGMRNDTRKYSDEEAWGKEDASQCERQMAISIPNWKRKGWSFLGLPPSLGINETGFTLPGWRQIEPMALADCMGGVWLFPCMKWGLGALPQPYFCRKDWHSSSLLQLSCWKGCLTI